MLGHFGQVLESQLLEEIGLSGEESRQRGVEVRSNAPDQATELWCASIVCRVGDELDGRSRNPAKEPVLARANRILSGVGRAPAGRRNVFPDVLRHDRQLVHGVVELLRTPSVEPVDSGRRIGRADRVDVRYERSHRRSERRVLRAGDGESHIVRPHREAVVPLCRRIDVKRDAERIGAPRPVICEAGREPFVIEDVEGIADVREAVVDHVSHLRRLNALNERWDQNIGIPAGGDRERSPGVVRRRRLGSKASAYHECAKEPRVSHRRHVQSSSRKCGTCSSVSSRTSSSSSTVASASSSDRTASNIALATSLASGERPSSA